MNKLITIIIPCHNCSTTIVDCWNSIKEQTIGLRSLEIILVDDASDDQNVTWNALSKIEASAPDSVIIIHLDKNVRQGGARNAALPYIHGKYFMFVDADDTIEPDSCEKLYYTAEAADADMVLFNCTYRDHNGNSIPRVIYKEHQTLDLSNDTIRRQTLLGNGLTYGCWDKLYRTEFYRSVGSFFPEHVIYEEPLFVYPLFFYATRIEILPEYLYNYYIHANSTVTEYALQHRGDHPAVQFLLLSWLKKHTDIFSKYYEEITFYIVWSAFIETLVFTKNDPESDTAYPFYEYIRSILIAEFPDYSKNHYIRSLGYAEIFAYLEQPIETQEALKNLRTLIKKANL